MKNTSAKLVLITGILLIAGALWLYFNPWPGWADKESQSWQLTIVGRDGAERVLSFKEITSLPAYRGEGGFFSTVGIVYGPYKVKGVPLEDLCRLVGGLEPSDAVMVSAQDGYSTVLDYEQVMGDFITYSADLKEVPHQQLKTILIYQREGRWLPDDEGKPLRLAVAGPSPGLLIEGNYWVKWVNRIEVLKAP
ncbi:MAG: molybdopterin-dependent oxidoreductase [Syntrophomonadaceae bacterium]